MTTSGISLQGNGYVDIHCHLLPGVDDGAGSLEESLRMAEMAVRDGIRKIVLTPHCDHPRIPNSGPAWTAALKSLKTALSARGLHLELVMGGEITLTGETLDRLKCHDLPTLGGSRFVLLELPDPPPLALEEELFRFRLAGFLPILAHVERYRFVQASQDLILRLVAQGALCQVTAMSLTGGFGRRAAKAVRRLLLSGAVHFIATDAHDDARRPPLIQEAVDEAARILSDRSSAESMARGETLSS